MKVLALMAMFAGGSIAVQAAMNARLGIYLKSAWLATGYAFLTSFLLIATLIVITHYKTIAGSFGQITFSTIPWYLWCSCVLSVIGVGTMYWLIPKMGVGIMMSYALTGQLVVAMLISHFGLFESPQKALSLGKLVGSVFLVIGIVLINKD